MYKGTYRIAKQNIEVRSLYDTVQTMYEDYRTDAPCEFSVETTEADIEFERVRSDKTRAQEGRPPMEHQPDNLETLAVYRKLCEYMLTKNIILFHCSALMMDGEAYLFTAPSGTGKSTHARLWREHFGDRVTMINDDKPLIEFTDSDIIVYGTPYSGKHNLQTNTSAPVKGIVILHQAEKNTIRRITAREAFSTLLGQSYRINRPDAMMKTMGLVGKMSTLPLFSLGCTISDEAVMLAYNALKGIDCADE